MAAIDYNEAIRKIDEYFENTSDHQIEEDLIRAGLYRFQDIDYPSIRVFDNISELIITNFNVHSSNSIQYFSSLILSVNSEEFEEEKDLFKYLSSNNRIEDDYDYGLAA